MKNKTDKIWRRLYAYEAEIYGFIKSAIGDGEIARDICQDVYLTVIQNISNLDEDRSLKNWLFTVTRNKVINYLKSRDRKEFCGIKDSVLTGMICEKSDEDLINEIISELPARQKKVLFLRETEGWSYEEIADDLNLSLSACTSLIKRSRENFQKKYLLRFLPEWFAKVGSSINIDDLLRFINPFDPPVNLVKQIDSKTKSYFANVVADWDNIRNQYLQKEELENIFNLIPAKEKMNVLDLGAGTGFVSIPLANREMNVIALDNHPAMTNELAEMKKKSETLNLNIINSDINKIPVRVSAMGLICAVLVLHHLHNPVGALRNIIKHLEEGGYFLIIDFLRHNQKQSADRMGDIWMGFDSGLFVDFFEKNNFKLYEENIFGQNKKMKLFYQIWQKTEL